jgi:hypothetical protein
MKASVLNCDDFEARNVIFWFSSKIGNEQIRQMKADFIHRPSQSIMRENN